MILTIMQVSQVKETWFLYFRSAAAIGGHVAGGGSNTGGHLEQRELILRVGGRNLCYRQMHP